MKLIEYIQKMYGMKHITINEEGIENLNLSITGEFKPLSDLIYDYFVQHPSYRLKEVTGMVER